MSAAIRTRIVVVMVVSLVSWGVGTRVSAEPGEGGHPVVVTFTKWVTSFPNKEDSVANMKGVVGGDVVGDFAGEVFERQTTTNTEITSITWLVAIYEIHAGPHSFTALVQGGQNNQTNKALLDGVILGGWLTGARVQVGFLQINNSTDCTNAGAPPSTSPCFQGTIRIEPESNAAED